MILKLQKQLRKLCELFKFKYYLKYGYVKQNGIVGGTYMLLRLNNGSNNMAKFSVQFFSHHIIFYKIIVAKKFLKLSKFVFKSL